MKRGAGAAQEAAEAGPQADCHRRIVLAHGRALRLTLVRCLRRFLSWQRSWAMAMDVVSTHPSLLRAKGSKVASMGAFAEIVY